MNIAQKILWASCTAVLLAIATASGGAELDPKAVVFKLPDQIAWGPVTPAGNQQAVLFGDPSKPGLYGVMTKWLAGNHFSRPHFHPNDRYITVLSGTWWVGSGDKFDPDSTVPVPPGSYVIHYARKVHYDGAKDEETIIQVWGIGPATSFPAEQR